ncbi:MAG: DUF3990 domain-containing protein [Prevotellaceae bacterium]|jgi:hypothetical protein|nr:DUF3990 domain-containing protein [Prevotellaceae bacterium]
MKIYHGTNIEFGAIDLNLCPPDRDFGQGFYCTNIKNHAKERAKEKTKNEGGKSTVLEYDFDIETIKQQNPDLKIKQFPEINEEWARFVMFNRLRKADEQPHEYDIVEGAVANDKMFRQFRRFANNEIDLNKFINSLKYTKEPTHQIVFCTEKALDILLVQNEPIRYKIEELVTNLAVELIKDYNFSTAEAMKAVYDSDIFTQLADETTKLYKKDWNEIYKLLLNGKNI